MNQELYNDVHKPLQAETIMSLWRGYRHCPPWYNEYKLPLCRVVLKTKLDYAHGMILGTEKMLNKCLFHPSRNLEAKLLSRMRIIMPIVGGRGRYCLASRSEYTFCSFPVSGLGLAWGWALLRGSTETPERGMERWPGGQTNGQNLGTYTTERWAKVSILLPPVG